MDPTTTAVHEVLAVVLQVREGDLRVLLWERGRDPCRGRWALPGGLLEPDETLELLVGRADRALYSAKKSGRDRLYTA